MNIKVGAPYDEWHYVGAEESVSSVDREEGRDYVVDNGKWYSEEDLDKILTPIKIPGNKEQLHALRLKDFLFSCREEQEVNL